jgi:tRNA1Val (adenine37-N6)-methyltransferase
LNDLQSDRDEMSRAKHSDNETVNRLFKLVNSILSNEGYFWIIIPHSNNNFFKEIAAENELHPCELIHIHAKSSKLNKRIISCFKRNQSEIVNERDLIIRTENNDYSSEYQKITKDFHRNLIK